MRAGHAGGSRAAAEAVRSKLHASAGGIGHTGGHTATRSPSMIATSRSRSAGVTRKSCASGSIRRSRARKEGTHTMPSQSSLDVLEQRPAGLVGRHPEHPLPVAQVAQQRARGDAALASDGAQGQPEHPLLHQDRVDRRHHRLGAGVGIDQPRHTLSPARTARHRRSLSTGLRRQVSVPGWSTVRPPGRLYDVRPSARATPSRRRSDGGLDQLGQR
jgi:hypothetical protein